MLCAYLKVFITQISFQFSRINTLWRGSLLKLSQRVKVPRNANYEMLKKHTKTRLFTQDTKELSKAHLLNIHPRYNQSIGNIWVTCTPLNPIINSWGDEVLNRNLSCHGALRSLWFQPFFLPRSFIQTFYFIWGKDPCSLYRGYIKEVRYIGVSFSIGKTLVWSCLFIVRLTLWTDVAVRWQSVWRLAAYHPVKMTHVAIMWLSCYTITKGT